MAPRTHVGPHGEVACACRRTSLPASSETSRRAQPPPPTAVAAACAPPDWLAPASPEFRRRAIEPFLFFALFFLLFLLCECSHVLKQRGAAVPITTIPAAAAAARRGIACCAHVLVASQHPIAAPRRRVVASSHLMPTICHRAGADRSRKQHRVPGPLGRGRLLRLTCPALPCPCRSLAFPGPPRRSTTATMPSERANERASKCGQRKSGCTHTHSDRQGPSALLFTSTTAANGQAKSARDAPAAPAPSLFLLRQARPILLLPAPSSCPYPTLGVH